MPANVVLQKDAYGCSLACYAMVVGVTYEEAREAVWRGTTHRGGTSRRSLLEAFNRAGYAYQIWSGFRSPFAPIHVLEAMFPGQREGTWHSVVMTGEGRVIDPKCEEARTLESYDYVRATIGLWYVSERPAIQPPEGEQRRAPRPS